MTRDDITDRISWAQRDLNWLRGLQTNCTTCHDTARICAKLDTPGADWTTTVRIMGERGNLSAEVQETVLTCLTTSADSKKQLCPTQTP